MNTKGFLSLRIFFLRQNMAPEVGLIELCDEKGTEIINMELRLRSGRMCCYISNGSFIKCRRGEPSTERKVGIKTKNKTRSRIRSQTKKKIKKKIHLHLSQQNTLAGTLAPTLSLPCCFISHPRWIS